MPNSQAPLVATTIALVLSSFRPAIAQEQAHYFAPIASEGQIVVGDSTGNDPNKPPTASQLLLDGHAAVAVGMSQMPSQPQSVVLWLWLINHDAPIAQVDDSKFFVLDGQGQQLRHISLDEVKYSVQSWVAQNWRSGNYPPPTPPPPQRQYVITGTQNGNYTFTEMGNIGTLSGSPTSTYNVQEQTNSLNQSGYMLGYSLGLALRQRADRKYNSQFARDAQQTLAQLGDLYFKSESPIIPGETRRGGIIYSTGSSRAAEGPFKVVLFLTDPRSGKQGPLTFEFR